MATPWPLDGYGDDGVINLKWNYYFLLNATLPELSWENFRGDLKHGVECEGNHESS